MCVFVLLHEAPSQPRDVNVSNVRTNSCDVTWQAPAKPNGRLEHLKYKILLQNGSLPYPTKKIVVTGGTIRRYTVTGLTQLTRYSLKIIAVNVDQTDEELQSPPSQVINFTTTAGRKCKTKVHMIHKRFTLPRVSSTQCSTGNSFQCGWCVSCHHVATTS